MGKQKKTMPIKKFEMEWAGRPLVVETGYLAHQANGSCHVKYGDTEVLATAVINKEPKEGTTYFPLMVDYEEKMYAAGRIKGSRFIKRETRPTDEAVLTSRLIDRGMRPLFDERIRNDVQVIITVLAIDGENDPDIPAILGASIAMHMSDIPWNGPLAGIRVGKIDGEYVLNPSYNARQKCDFDLTVCYHKDKVINIEAGCNETDEKTIFEAFKFGQKHTKKILKFIEDIAKEVGREKMEIPFEEADEELLDDNQKLSLQELEKLTEEAKAYALDKLDKYLFNIPKGSKRERKEIVYKLKDELIDWLSDKNVGKDRIKKVLEFFDDFVEIEVSRAIIEKDQRVDGRALNDVRRLSSQVGFIKRTHGSSVFNRGETQVMAVVTLGSPGDEQKDSCTITTSRHIQWAKPNQCAALAGVKSATALWRKKLYAP
jgi:polyribonucleotide nucleotidyltransferase